MENNNTKSIRFSTHTNQKMEGLASKLGLSKKELLEQMVEYFYRTKKDPADINDEILKNTLAKSHKTYMSFIKAQEDLLLIPIKTSTDKMISNQKDIVKYFNEQVLSANKNLLKNQQMFLDKINSLEKLLSTAIDQKDKLKSRFQYILNNYIRNREELGSFKGREKEELAEQTRKQIENL